MPAPQRRFASAVNVGVSVPAAVETIAAQTEPVSSSFPGCCFLVEFYLTVFGDGDATGLDVFIRRQSLTGVLFDNAPHIGGMDTVNRNSFAYASIVDQSDIDSAGVIWVCSVLAAGGGVTVNGSVSSVTVDVSGQPSSHA